MNDFDLDAVIDDVLDGTADAGARAWLERRLAVDAGARARYAARESLFRTLAGPPPADPPADLVSGVMREIAATGSPAAPAPASARPAPIAPSPDGWWSQVVTAFQYRPARAWGFVATFAALAVALVLVAVRLPSLTGSREMPAVGTIGGAPRDRGTTGPITLLAHGAAELEGARVTAEVRPGASGDIELTFHSEAAAGVSVAVGLAVEPGDATLAGEGPGLAGDGSPAETVRFDDARFGVVRIHPERSGPLRVVLTATTAKGAAHTTLEIPAVR